jgi:hypothetical protein
MHRTLFISITICSIFFLDKGALYSQQQPQDQVVIARQILEQREEVSFIFSISDANQLRQLTRIISIDRVDKLTVRAVANRQEFEKFLSLGIPFTVVPEEKEEPMPKSLQGFGSPGWNTYPSYQQYDSIMKKFAADYPQLCSLVSIGKSVKGKDIYFVKISDNVTEDEPEPEFMYTASIHGDETVGYILMIRLIDYLLRNYPADAQVKKLVNRMEIWINPLSNPDGTYYTTDANVISSRRYNYNSVDLNRNYPDPAEGPHPDNNSYQPETVAMMDFIHDHHFVMSANFHGGAEVMNYPWDTWYPGSPDFKPHADKSWFEFICHEYADTAQKYGPSGYLTDLDDGVTNGAEWYTIAGGRQDYVTYFRQGREVTMEISNTKRPSAIDLPQYWDANYRSLLNYMEQALYGIRGTVKDADTGMPVKAYLHFPGHDRENSEVYSDSLHGFFTRLLDLGTYSIEFTASGYFPLTVNDVVVNRYNTTFLQVEMEPDGTGTEHDNLDRIRIYPNPVSYFLTIEVPRGIQGIHAIRIQSLTGADVYYEAFPPQYEKTIQLNTLSPGFYLLEVVSDRYCVKRKLLVSH